MLIGTIGKYEFWDYRGQIYRVEVGNYGPLNDQGVPANARWECSRAHFDHYRPLGVFGQ